MQIARTRTDTPEPDAPWTALAVESADVAAADGTAFASATVAMPAFFLGWVALGVLAALTSIHKGADARTMIALGAGLGPLALVLAFDRGERPTPQPDHR